MLEPVIYDMTSPGRRGFRFPELDVPKTDLPKGILRKDLPLPEVSEIEIIRHFTKLSQLTLHGKTTEPEATMDESSFR